MPGGSGVAGIIADADILGHVARLMNYLGDPARAELWTALELRTASFAELGLDRSTPDRTVWLACQTHKLVLITANRNHKGRYSLAATIEDLNSDVCLPVMTLADPGRLLTDSGYADAVADDLLEYLYDIENLLGAGRLFLPKSAG